MSESEVWNHRDNDGTSSSVVVGDDDDDDDEEEEEEENDVASAGGGVDSEQTDIVNQELSVRSSSSLSMLIANLQLNDDGSNLLVNVPLNSHTQESASSSPSIVSSANNQSALPPIIYGQLNKNQYMLGSVTYYVRILYCFFCALNLILLQIGFVFWFQRIGTLFSKS